MAGEKYKPEGDVLVQGINAMIYVDLGSAFGENAVAIGFVESYSIRQNINIQRAECIGTFDVVSIDPTGRSVTWNLSGFIPNKALITADGIDSVRGGGRFTLKNFNPNTDKLADSKVFTKIPYMALVNEKPEGKHDVIGYSTWLVPSSFQEGGQGKGYIKVDITLEAVSYDNGEYEYESLI